MNVSKGIWKLFNKFYRINSRLQHGPCYKLCGSAIEITLKTRKVRPQHHRKFSSSNDHYLPEIEEITSIYPYVERQASMYSDITKHILFKNSNDNHSEELAKCVSVKEVFTFVKHNINELNYKHLAQVILIIKELKSIYTYHYKQPGEVDRFLNKLLEHQEFFQVTTAIKSKLDEFDPVCLSYTLCYLHKLDIPVESELIQRMALKLRDHLLKDFNLETASRLINVIFNEISVRPYYIVIDLIPSIYKQIDNLKGAKDLEEVTLCLYKMNNIVTGDIVAKYTSNVNRLINDRIITKKDYKVVIMVASFFNLPIWRFRSSDIISKCLLLIEDSMEKLDYTYMCHLYDIFFKNQEPGDVLNSIQRSTAKLLHEINDTDANQLDRLKLFSSLIYYSSPMNKKQFRNDIIKYVSEHNTWQSLITLRKIFSYLKISDPKLCELYWNKACQILKKENDFEKALKLMENYLYFCGDILEFKHPAFEHHVLTMVQKRLDSGLLTIYPSRFFMAYSFALVCCYNTKLLDILRQKFKELTTQLTAVDIFRLSHSLQLLHQRKSIIGSSVKRELSSILLDQTAILYNRPNVRDYTKVLLLKSAVMRRDYSCELVDDMLIRLKEMKTMSSKLMEFMCYNLQSTKSLIPEVINLCTGYITARKKNIVGFNAEKILNLLFDLNYQPVYEEEFFKTVIDILIRDQERMSGLGFLQASLSLCYFNQMPKSFVKQIFNVEFLDKLDIELANCYYKDKYPHRVRDVLMQLNRAVCLEYPEYDVPWFHQKYIEEYQKNYPINAVVNTFHRSVKGYLQSILGEDLILENMIIPYGYWLNFVYHLDKDRKPTANIDDPGTTKFAVLLRTDPEFTQFYVRLRGRQALKDRHLEILGYRVKTIKENQWKNLLYAEERAEFINQIVFS